MRAIKKIVALATGATMLGATVMGAMAATLADYPSPLFIKDGQFAGSIVVGDQAAAEDVVGAIDIATSLQYSATSATGAGGVTTVIATGENAKIETDSTKLTLHSSRDALTEVKTTPLDDDDLPTILADGTYRSDDNKDYNFQQKIEFNDTVLFKHYADTDFKDKEPNLMVYGDRRKGFLYYTFDFVKAAESTNTSGTLDDLEDSSITMLGKKYDITNADILGTKVTLDLMGGAIKDTLEQGETKTYTLNGKDYEVTINFIGTVSSTSKVKLTVNDEVTDAMAENDIYKLADDTEVSIKEILEEEAGEVTADMVEFYLGAEKLTLVDPVFGTTGYGSSTNSDNVRLSDEDIDDLYVDIAASWSSDKLKVDKILFTWKPDDEIFVADDSEVTFPGLGSFKLSYQGFSTGDAETIRIEPHGNSVIEMTVPLETGSVTFD
ncbi:hypothetical protein KY317_01495, partial [Candidatus Woesearchaeota archaeon]|nr:hypothetical protein [Candidatus Woesearchaeota archaeon]